MAELFAYTDGACSGNPGPGGWGVLMQAKDGQTVLKQRDLKGGEAVTTNNRMELLAAINALEALERPSEITIFTDSTYVKNGITQWMHGWKRNGWKTAAKKPVKNVELWQQLDEAQARHSVIWKWVKGHAVTPKMKPPMRLPAPGWPLSSHDINRAKPCDRQSLSRGVAQPRRQVRNTRVCPSFGRPSVHQRHSGGQ